MRRGGVPVLRRVREKPRLSREADRASAAGRESPPLSLLSFPVQTRPRRLVPAVIITHFAYILPLFCAVIPLHTYDFPPFTPASAFSSGASTAIIPVARSSRTSRLAWRSTTERIRSEYSALAHCVRVARTAGPRLRFKIFAWRAVASALRPISPPSASSSCTRWLLASPPMEGLHGIFATSARDGVTRRVLAPMRAAASAASTPACPPPTTIASYPVVFALIGADYTISASSALDRPALRRPCAGRQDMV